MTRRTLLSAVVVAALATGPADACFLEMGVAGGFVTSDPLTIPVLVAARDAAAGGRIGWFSSRDAEAVRNAILFLSAVPSFAGKTPIGAGVNKPAFSVLQAQTGYWTRYKVEDNGALAAEGHRAGPGPGDAVIVVSDSALLAILRGRLDFADARETGLLRGRGEAVESAMSTFEDMVTAFRASSLGARISTQPIPLIDHF
jgi:hypothetical protein